MTMINPILLDDLCRSYQRTHSRDDVLSWWINATRSWGLIPDHEGINEPAEVTAARTLWVHAHLCGDPQEQQELLHGMWALVAPFTQHNARMLAQHRGLVL